MGCTAADIFPSLPSRSVTHWACFINTRCIWRYIVCLSRTFSMAGTPKTQHRFVAMTFKHKIPSFKEPREVRRPARRRHKTFPFYFSLCRGHMHRCRVQVVLPAFRPQRRLGRVTRSTVVRSECFVFEHAYLTRHGKTGEVTSRFAHHRNALSDKSATSC